MFSNTIQKSIDAFKRLPGIGPRQATRCVFYLLKTRKEEFAEFVETLRYARERSRTCQRCFRIFETSNEAQIMMCDICRSKKREQDIIMIVEDDQDLVAIERVRKFTGLFMILKDLENGKKIDIETKDKIMRLVKLLKEKNPREVIIATNHTLRGNFLAYQIRSGLQNTKIKITRLAHGLPTGAEIEYADDETLEEAIEGRR